MTNIANLANKTSGFKNLNTIILVGTLVLMLGIINWEIFQKEQQIRQGDLVYLELAPVDPRSLMQGDYMALRFKMSNDIRSALKLIQEELTQEELVQTEQNLAEANREWRQLPNSDGYVVVSFDSRNIASYKALYNQQDLAANEMKLLYRVRDGSIKFATNAFFFQEGHASIYESAQYGEFRVNSNGEPLLTAMFDAELNKLLKP
ncbi:GDYXXLXY domain-containing protein [Shewanella donghaensis]|uniref:GDYXXLXY domain-containing protein n=1 Tax=Shewanella donghaensis TaxID=238836 RepID=UPI001181CE3B|nr:GDYXXLXY domain-containing protein [Shewanella donghaensis]